PSPGPGSPTAPPGRNRPGNTRAKSGWAAGIGSRAGPGMTGWPRVGLHPGRQTRREGIQKEHSEEDREFLDPEKEGRDELLLELEEMGDGKESDNRQGGMRRPLEIPDAESECRAQNRAHQDKAEKPEVAVGVRQDAADVIRVRKVGVVAHQVVLR